MVAKSAQDQRTFTLQGLAEFTGSQLVGDPNHVITGVDHLESADSEDASFLANPRYKQAMLESSAGVIFVSSKELASEGRNFLINDDPSGAFQKVVEEFLGKDRARSGFSGVHPTAVIHEDAELDPTVTVGPNAVIDRGARIGNRTVIGANCYIGPHVEIGDECYIHPSVVVEWSCRLGDRVILYPGAVIGSSGYGYSTDSNGVHHRIEQLGIVEIEDDVEIGANTTIDRARFKRTLIRNGAKLDNQVQIAHQVTVGRHNLIIAQVGIAGSTKLGDHVTIAGQTGVLGHIRLADRVTVAACSAVAKSIEEEGSVWGGTPATPLREQLRLQVAFRRLCQDHSALKKLRKRVDKLEQTHVERT